MNRLRQPPAELPALTPSAGLYAAAMVLVDDDTPIPASPFNSASMPFSK